MCRRSGDPAVFLCYPTAKRGKDNFSFFPCHPDLSLPLPPMVFFLKQQKKKEREFIVSRLQGKVLSEAEPAGSRSSPNDSFCCRSRGNWSFGRPVKPQDLSPVGDYFVFIIYFFFFLRPAGEVGPLRPSARRSGFFEKCPNSIILKKVSVWCSNRGRYPFVPPVLTLRDDVKWLLLSLRQTAPIPPDLLKE